MFLGDSGKMKIWKSFLLFFLILILIVTISAGIYIGLIYMEYNQDKEAVFSKLEEFARVLETEEETDTLLEESNENPAEKKATIVYDRNGRIITKYSSEKYKLASIQEMPFFLTRGFIYIEDRKFYEHHGVNYIRLARAVFDNIRTLGHAGGGSTISQQLSKILFTKHERSIKRKIYELFCTFELESRFSKNEILKIYLNSNYMGHGTYGIANAASFYFGKSATELTIAEAALLVGMNRSPERYSPIRNRKNAEYILSYVIGKFVEAGFLTEEQATFETERFWENFGNHGILGEQSIWKTEINKSGYLTEYVRQILEKEFSYDKITAGGLIVETSFDLEKQSLAETTVSGQLKNIRHRVKNTADKMNIAYDNKIINRIEGSFVSVDYENGEVYTLVGGSGYLFSNQLNRAISANRQVGSSIKPFVYAKALDIGELDGRGIHPFTKFKDEIKTFKVNGRSYTPKNYSASHKYGSMVSIYDALKRSLNTVAVQTMELLPMEEVVQLVGDAAGVIVPTKRIPAVLSLSLGTAELSALELATAYCVFPRGGKSVFPTTIRRISDTRGNVYYDSKRKINPYFRFLQPEGLYESKTLLSQETACEMLQMMGGVFEKGGTGYWAATACGLNKKAYGKSGTTQDYKDGWFAGITGKEVSACWVGIDSGESLLLSGEATAAVIWADYNAKVFSDISTKLPVSQKMKLLRVCRESGLEASDNCTDCIDFYFNADGPLPEHCYIHSNDIMIIEEDF